jgi:hypothetical protein
MNKLASIAVLAAGLFLSALPTTASAQDCRQLRYACEHKDELGLQGAGTCGRYKEQCRGGHGGGGGFNLNVGGLNVGVGGGGSGRCRQLRYACEHKDEVGSQGAGSCKRYRDTCS